MTDSGTTRREIAKTKAKKKAKSSRALKKKAEERPKINEETFSNHEQDGRSSSLAG